MTMNATDLQPGSVVTAWWVVWNHPELCSPPACGPEDLPTNGGNPDAEASMLYADGQVVRDDGTAIYTVYLSEGDTSGEAVFEAAGI